MKKIIILLLVINSSCKYEKSYTYKSKTYNESIKYEIVDFNDIVESPDKYDNKNIIVKGFFRTGFEITAIFENKQIAMTHDDEKAIWITFESLPEADYSNIENFDKRSITIKGKYNKNDKGHLGIFNGGIKATYIETMK